ncbi:Zinc carboxypeptidase [Filimonas lacunae]|uniref:Zinc carboxypeptidase n=1 Tax=Filimonas lacunae TaxID=477680 RepID=A0A173MLN1_9BACT|nr:M14 family metallopeptidase [Filimonas lacunae]BAV08555.1 M14 family carboxypeptidase [Filimonas lacunae]SIS57018.1 Zinc carboxypeptidase [Filimonas lacunae]
MRKMILFLGILLTVTGGYAQNIASPEQFLGYPLGTRFTPHYQLVNYFKAVAAAKPDMVKTEQYGETYEHRPLMLAYIALPNQLPNLEEVRLNNLRMAGVLKDKAADTVNMPSVVWLSYNVHGNEPSSSEAAMQTLYALVNPANQQTKQWLQNTVVIIDPCLNPDGRDRYVNWYNSMVGRHYNANPESREHDEPWPGGRSNHYNFDLNRDWAWQTQQETKFRLQKYNTWLPQVHVDFHEQGYNNPYYFAPAAEPFHDAITPWQRDFQVLIGRNNASYFDKEGWLYFTRERFDLFYPSYGDTYPMYNGSIGMTFEQGGHSRGGLAVVKADGDTLTLVDRVAHHYTTGLSTIEVAATQHNKLLKEFKKFFDENAAAKGSTYKTYVLTAKNANQLASIKRVLQANNIKYGVLNNKTFKGFNYFSGKEESFKDEGVHLAISAYQPQGNMVRVLFEPTSVLTDSVTYDITAWSLPYVYNIKGYAVKEKLAIENTIPANDSVYNSVASAYGLLIPYNSMTSAQVLAGLLNRKIKVRFSRLPFTYKGHEYARGTLIVLKSGNKADWNNVTNEVCRKFNLQPEVVETGFVDKGADFGSSDIGFIQAPRVAMLTGEQTSSLGAGEVWSFFDQVLDYPITLLNATDIEYLNLKNVDVLILPDGYYRVLNDKDVNARLKTFVKEGGKLIAMERAVSKLADADWGIKSKNDDDDNDKKDEYASLHKFSSRERDEVTGAIPGAIFKVEMDDTHPLAYGYGNDYYTLKQDPAVYSFLKDGWNVGVLKKDSYVAGFVGSKLKPKLKDGLVFGAQEMGRGSVVYLADDPLFRHFWDGGKLLFTNAVFLVGQ